jgi:hypothetical protein
LCSSINVGDQVSDPYRTTGKSIILYIVIFTFLGNQRTQCIDWNYKLQIKMEIIIKAL